MIIKTEVLNEKSFREYGQILSEKAGEPMADDDIISYWGKVANIKFDKNISTGVLFGHKRLMATKNLERHIETPEVLVALSGDAVICVAVPSKQEDEPDKIKAFYIKQGDAISLYRGIWHWTPFPVDSEQCKFLVMFNNDTESKDLYIKNLSEDINIIV